MKISGKILSSFLAFALLVSASACSGGGGTSSSASSSEKSSSSSSSVSAKPAESSSSSSAASSAAQGKKDVVVWHWSEEYITTTGKEFEKTHPEYHVACENVPKADVVNRFNTLLASGGKIPDVITVDWSASGTILSDKYNGLFIDLSAAPYNVDKTAIVDWVVGTTTSSNGELRGFEIGPAPTTLAYTKSVAQKYFGVSDAEALYSKLSSWDAVLEAGRKLKADSKGTAYLGTDISQFAIEMLMQNDSPTIKDKKILLRQAWKSTFEFLHTLMQEGLVEKITEPAAITDAMANHPDKYLLWKCAMWEPRWTFLTNAPKQIGTFATLPTLPGGTMAVGGGVLISIPSGAPNKQGGFEYANWLRNTSEGCACCRDNYGDISSLKKDYKDASFHKAPSDLLTYFGGVDPVKQFASYIDKTHANYKTAYDLTLWGDSFTLALQAIRDGKSADDAITAAVNELIRVYPELSE